MTPGRQPPRPLPPLSTADLRAYRRQLERAVAFFSRKDPAPPVRDSLQARLGQVIAAHDGRAGTGHA